MKPREPPIRVKPRSGLLRVALLILLGSLALAASPLQAQLVRRVNTSIKLPSVQPEPSGYTTVNALGSLTFNAPIFVASIPGDSTRLYVVERGGRVQVVTNLAGTPVKSEFLNLAAVTGVSGLTTGGENGLLSLAFHPNFASNREFFIFYSFNSGGLRQRIARLRAESGNPNRADHSFIEPLITQSDRAGNHNGGTVAFGPDGYLYISVGDEGGANDTYNNARFIDKNFFSALLRIDVDKKPGSLTPNAHPAVHTGAYTIPPDNPFIGRASWHGRAINPAQVRTEIWATSLRNPFRFSFDAPTGRLFCADVGQNSYEEVHLIRKGDDCGWSWREGNAAFTSGPAPTTPPPAPAFSPAAPIHTYAHTGGGRSITGGVVYRGSANPALIGRYLFADYLTGQITALRQEGGSWKAKNLGTATGITGFGHHPLTGEVLMCAMSSGRVLRLVASDPGPALPAVLSQTGAFSDLATLAPATGVVPYEVNHPFWSDGAEKTRWFAVRGSSAKFGYQENAPWTLPTGTVWIKHFEIETTPGNAATRRRIETRFLIKTASSVYGITYQWREDQSDADLVPLEGLDEIIPDTDPPQTWRFPAQGECQACHTPQGGFALGFNTAQLNRPSPLPSHGNQLQALAAAGYLTTKNLPPPGMMPAHPDRDDPDHSLDQRVRAYLDVNCAPCHQPGALASTWDARHHLPIEATGLIDGEPANNGGDPDLRLLVPGDPARSLLWHRLAGSAGFSRMPPLATNVADTQGIALLTDWIETNLASSITLQNQPVSVDVSATGTAVFSVAATGSGTLHYQWQKDRQNLPGETGDTLTITSVSPADVAGYRVIVSDDEGSLASRGALLRIVIKKPTITSDPPPDDATVSALFDWPLSADEPSTLFTVTGLPRGLRYDAVNRRITGLPTRPGTYTVTITGRTSAGKGEPVSFTFTIDPLPLGDGQGGTWAALVERVADLNQNLGGRLQFDVAPTGAVSAVLAHGRATHRFSDRLRVVPGGVIQLLKTLRPRGAPELTLDVEIDPADGSLSGSLSSTAGSAHVEGHAFLNPAALPADAARALSGRAWLGHGSLSTEDQDDASVPQGVPWWRLSGQRRLRLSGAGRLGEGSALTFSLQARDPHLTFYRSLHRKQGSLLGHFSTADAGLFGHAPGDPALAGSLHWTKLGPAGSRDRLYAAGFSLPLTTATHADAPPAPAINRLGSLDGTANAAIEFRDGGLDGAARAQLDQLFRLDPAGRVFLDPATAAPVALKLRVNHRLGLFSGSFQLSENGVRRGGQARGLFVPDASTSGFALGLGSFTLPGLPPASAPILSGRVTLSNSATEEDADQSETVLASPLE